jgi:hypothetical protein
VLKVSVTLAAPNLAGAPAQTWARRRPPAGRLSRHPIAAIRALRSTRRSTSSSPDDFGGAVRHYRNPELVRVAAPIYLKFGLRNHGPLYPSGLHPRAGAGALARACGALDRPRALKRYAPKASPRRCRGSAARADARARGPDLGRPPEASAVRGHIARACPR